jgi:hypothetical protein
VKNLLYRRTDDVERLQKVIGDTEQQFVDSLRRIKTLGEELESIRGAARELVDVVDPPEEGEANPRPLLERLCEAPKKVMKFLSEAPVSASTMPSQSSSPSCRARSWRYLLKAWRRTAPRSNSTDTS